MTDRTCDTVRRRLFRSTTDRRGRLREIVEVRHRFYRRWRQSTTERRGTVRRFNAGSPTSRGKINDENSRPRRYPLYLACSLGEKKKTYGSKRNHHSRQARNKNY